MSIIRRFFPAIPLLALTSISSALAADEARNPDLAYELLSDITTQFGPRPAGSPAETAAAAWGAARLRQMGFDKVVIEPFGLRVWKPGETSVELIGRPSQRLVAMPMGGLVAGPPVEASVAVFDSYAAFLAAPASSVNGKIVAILEAMPRGVNGEGYLALGRMRTQGPGEAARRGAVGYVIRSLSTADENLANSGATKLMARPFPAFSLSPSAAEQLGRAAARGPVSLRLSSTCGWAEQGQSQNVVAEITGRDSTAAPLIIGAHIDSWEQGTGAIDDGFGVATVTAAAASILKSGHRPTRTIKIVWFGSEEVNQDGAFPDFVGARVFAHRHEDEVRKAFIVAESDWGGGRVMRITLPPTTAAPTVERLRALLASDGIPVTQGEPGPGVAEIGALAATGAPLLRLHQDASELFDTHHNANDTLGRVDRASLAQNVRIWSKVLNALADS